jgi:ketosteroid isomerase-like protein
LTADALTDRPPLFLMRVIFITACMLAAVVPAMAQTAAQRRQIESDIRRVMNDQLAAWNRGDIDGFMRGYWNSEDLVFVSGANVTRGWQPTLERYKKSYDSRSKMGTLTFSDLEINVLSRDAAVVLGSWALARDKDNPHGKFTLTFRRFPRVGLRIIIDHTS